MDNIWSSINLGNIPIPVLAIFILCIVGIIASGKPAETFGRLAACAVSYYLAVCYGPSLFMDDSAKMKLSLEGIPFLGYIISGEKNTIINLLFSNAAVFAKEFLKLFVFSLVVDTFFTVFKSFVDYCKNIKLFYLGYILPWFARYALCTFAMFAYIALYVVVLAPMPDKLWLALSIAVIIITALMLATPLIEFIILWADLIPNKFLKVISTFIKEHKMGGVLQVAFFATFSFASVLICVQEASPELLKRILPLP